MNGVYVGVDRFADELQSVLNQAIAQDIGLLRIRRQVVHQILVTAQPLHALEQVCGPDHRVVPMRGVPYVLLDRGEPCVARVWRKLIGLIVVPVGQRVLDRYAYHTVALISPDHTPLIGMRALPTARLQLPDLGDRPLLAEVALELVEQVDERLAVLEQRRSQDAVEQGYPVRPTELDCSYDSFSAVQSSTSFARRNVLRAAVATRRRPPALSTAGKTQSADAKQSRRKK